MPKDAFFIIKYISEQLTFLQSTQKAMHAKIITSTNCKQRFDEYVESERQKM